MDEPTPFLTTEGFDAYATDDDAIVQALAIRKWAAENNLLAENGEPRKILGTLPVTADGVIVGHGAAVDFGCIPATVYVTCQPASDTPDTSVVTQCTTRSAAEAAAKGGSDGQ
jgi:hypothetical protein